MWLKALKYFMYKEWQIAYSWCAIWRTYITVDTNLLDRALFVQFVKFYEMLIDERAR